MQIVDSPASTFTPMAYRSYRTGSELDSVRFHLLAQRVAIDAEHLRSVCLIALDPVKYGLEQRLLDAVDHHVVNASGALPVEILKVAFDGSAHDPRHLILVHHAASTSLYCRRRPRSARSAKNSS